VRELWTTPNGIGAWWAPDGFITTVDTLELRPGGSLDYTMTATGPDQIAFMEQAGMPLSTKSHKEFTEVDEPQRLAYVSLIDFVPGLDPYEQLTVVTFERTATGTEVIMACDPLHDDEWTSRLVAGRTNELDNLEGLVETDR
ncbi:MAG: SRPBCC domain-containing protein, partial [Nocardioidaceae bacterium]